MTPEEQQDMRDMRACMSAGGWLKRCAGKRLVIRGYVCPHCGSDDPDETCANPMKQMAHAPARLRELREPQV